MSNLVKNARANAKYLRDIAEPSPEADELDAMCDRIEALEAENARLRGALGFYSDDNGDGYDVEITDYGLSASKGEVIIDGGERARAALKGDT